MTTSGRRVVLVADDDPSDLFFMEQALREACPSIDVYTVSDGQEAIEYLAGQGRFADREAHPLPTHVFLDIKMPRRTGLEVLRWLRDQPGVGQTPVTVVSGSAIASDIAQAGGLGADYCVKPVEYVELVRFVEDFCRRRGFAGGDGG